MGAPSRSSYHGQEKKISIAVGTPVVTFAPATQADLTSGAAVFVPAERSADGALATGFVVGGHWNGGSSPADVNYPARVHFTSAVNDLSQGRSSGEYRADSAIS